MASRSGKTQFVLVAAALVLVAGVCTGLVAYYASARQTPSGLPELRYVPPDATALAYADLRGIMDSDLRRQLAERLPERDAQDRLREELGIDVEQDIDHVVAGFVGSAPSSEGAFVLLRGRFDRSRIEAAALDHGAVAETFAGTRVLLTPGSGWMSGSAGDADTDADRRGALAFLEDDLLAIGDEPGVRRALETRTTGDDVTGNDVLMQIVASLDGQHDAWVAGRFDAMAVSDLPPTFAQLALVEWYSIAASVDRTVAGELRAEARDDESATELRNAVQGAVSAARLMAGDDERLTRLLGSVQVAGVGRTVTLAFSVPPEFLEALGGLAGPALGDRVPGLR